MKLRHWIIASIFLTNTLLYSTQGVAGEIDQGIDSYDLRVLIIDNKRIENIEREKLDLILEDTKRIFFEEFGCEINFTTIDYKIDERKKGYCKDILYSCFGSP